MTESKVKISISVGDHLLKKIDEKVKEGLFRNRSHAFEYFGTIYFN